MTITDLVVLAGAVVVSAGLAWFFFGTKRPTQHAVRSGQSQQVTVIVHGGYTPSRIEAVAGLPLRITFDRRESGDCSSRVVFPDLGITRALPAYATTDIDLMPEQVGKYGFSCAMNMIHGSLSVTAPNATTDTPRSVAPAVAASPAAASADVVPDPAAEEAADAHARRVEVRELSYRVLAGAILTAPVLFAVMTHELFGANWIPGLMLNRWWQLAFITPVMFVVGAPIHRTGWLALRHRAADMNTLITFGTSAAFGYSLLVTVAPSLFPTDVRNVYFEAVGVILTLILLGRLLEAQAKAGTGEAIRAHSEVWSTLGMKPGLGALARHFSGRRINGIYGRGTAGGAGLTA